jgi:spermidine synthase
LHPDPKSVLVVGCGAGVTAGSFCVHPEVQHITICEIEPLIPKHIPDYFKTQNHDVLQDPRLQIVYDDARHFVLTTHQKFDIITSDPIHPWVKGAATLYTREYFQMVKNHLNPGGLVTQWVPLYESNLEAVKGEVATFFSVFPHGTIWSNDINGSGYDVVMLGQAEDNATIDIDAIQQRLDQPDHLLVAESLGEVNFKSAIDLLSTFAGEGPDLQAWLADAQINLDRNLRLQYIAGLGLNAVDGDKIFKSMIASRKFPTDLFQGSTDHLLQLRVAIFKSGGPQ